MNDLGTRNGQGAEDQAVPSIEQQAAPCHRGQEAAADHREAQVQDLVRARGNPKKLRALSDREAVLGMNEGNIVDDEDALCRRQYAVAAELLQNMRVIRLLV